MPSIYYALVSYGSTVLVDYTQCSGNFQQITINILERIDVSKNTRMSYSSEEYLFHIIIEDGIVYLCMADEDFGKSTPYAYLNEINRRFTSGSLKDRAPNCIAYELKRDFEAVLAQQMKKYNKGDFKNPNTNQIESLQKDVKDVQSIMTQNIGKVLDRGEKLNILVDKTENLSKSSESFVKTSRRLQRKMWWQNKKIMVILIIVLLIIAGVITVVILLEEGVIK